MRRRSLIITAGLAFVALTAAILLWPLPEALLSSTPFPHRILDRNGVPLYVVRPPGRGDSTYLPLRDLPPVLIQTLLAIEDRDFERHAGVSIRGTLRALWQNVTSGRIVSGGSTITQQLVRTLLPPRRRGYISKIREMILAWKLEWKLSKDDILERYLNTAYFGHQAYGIGSASKTFFGKNPSELSLGETAFLVGLLQSPSAYDPFHDPALSLNRWKRVLATLHDAGNISTEAFDDASSEHLRFAPDRVEITAPHFVFWTQAKDGEGSDSVRTTLDVNLQREVERIVERRIATLADRNVTSAAVVVLDAQNGDILSMVGSADYFDVSHDGAVNVALAPRQPGSAVKPFTYALALTHGDTAATTVPDVETRFLTQEGNPYVPRNYDYEEHGLVRYRTALANSYNIAAVRVLERVGVASLLSFLRDAGISTLTRTPEHYGLALTLGDAEVTLLDLTAAYGIFPRLGRTLQPRALLSDPVQQGRKILDDRVAWLITSILSDNTARLAEFGPDNPLTFSFPVGAKTGTTRNARDNWTIGFTDRRIVGVWVGNADNTPMRGTSGVTGAGPIFHDVMETAQHGLPTSSFPQPRGIVEREICMLSGKLATPLCAQRMEEYFISGTEPKEKDDLERTVEIDTRTGLLATAQCPASTIRRETFIDYPPDLQPWALRHGWKPLPSEISPLCGGQRTSSSSSPSLSSLTILSPQAGDSFELDPLIPRSDQRILLTAQAGSDVRTVEWTINGEFLGEGTAPSFTIPWIPTPGTWTIEARTGPLRQHAVVTVQTRTPQP